MTTRAFLAAVGTPIAGLAVLAAHDNPALYLYYAALALVLVAAGGYGAAWLFRSERDEARDELDRAAEEREVAERREAIWRDQNERMRQTLMEARLTDPATATTVLVPLLRPGHPRLHSIPTQRTGAHDDLPVADESFWTRLYDEKGGHRG